MDKLTLAECVEIARHALPFVWPDQRDALARLIEVAERVRSEDAKPFVGWHENETHGDERPCSHQRHEQHAWSAALAWARGER